MGHRFAGIAFTPSVRDIQQQQGSRAGYEAMDVGDDYNDRLSDAEAAFIAARDSVYMASVSETGWPYVQHRGGPVGFVKVLDSRTLGFADYSGNRQYITTGNVKHDDRVALFFMDYPGRTRLKLLGRVEVVDPDQAETIARLEDGHYRARIERGMIIRVEAFDWNCPQHITPRYSQAEMDQRMQPLLEHIRELRDERQAPAQVVPDVLGEGPLALVISGIRQLTTRIRAYELRAADGGALPPVEAGSHLAVPVLMPDGRQGMRHYSVASNPTRRDIYEIAVLRESDGHGGSQAVHEQYQLGTRLRVDKPHNHFSLHHDDRPAVLIAGGIGITPIKAMAQALAARGTPFELHYAGRSLEEMAFVGRLQLALGERIQVYPADQGTRLSVESILASAPDNALFYICGPVRLLGDVLSLAETLKIDANRMRYERFAASPQAHDRPVRVKLSRSGTTLDVAADETILDAALRAGVPAHYSCMMGQCRTCAVTVLAGEVDHRDQALSDSERERLMCPCVSRATSDTLTLDL